MRLCSFALFCLLCLPFSAAQASMIETNMVKLQALDKITARTLEFDVRVGSTVRFGEVYIKVQTCQQASPLAQPESASFLQVWEVTPAQKSQWIFSGWMFASSPAVSAMDHPVYDVWVIDCKNVEASANSDSGDKADSGPTESNAVVVVSDGEAG